MENGRLKLQLSERDKAVSRVQRSMSLLQHRLAVLSAADTASDVHQQTGSQLDSVNQVIRNIARKVACLSHPI